MPFSRPSFSADNSVRLFTTLYETCHWSANSTIRARELILGKKTSPISLGELRKQRRWLVDTVINERIGKEAFMKTLSNEGNNVFHCSVTKPLTKVLQWLERRFASEQLIAVQTLSSELYASKDRFHLANLSSVQAIIDLALNHLRQSSRIFCTIIHYGVLLLQRVKHHSNPERKAKI